MKELTERLKVLTLEIGQKAVDPSLTVNECYALSEAYLLLLEASKKLQRRWKNVSKN